MLILAFIEILVGAGIFVMNADATAAAIYFVSPDGNDENSGQHLDQPLQTIMKALELAQAGDTVRLASGLYWQDIRSIRAGRAEAPIQIIGSVNTVIKGGGEAIVIELNHHYLSLINIEIDGQIAAAEHPDSYREKTASGARPGTECRYHRCQARAFSVAQYWQRMSALKIFRSTQRDCTFRVSSLWCLGF